MLTLGFLEHPLNDRFVRGSEMSCWTLEYLQSGKIRVESLGEQWQCSAPSVMLIPPFTPYAVEWAGGTGRWTEIYAIFDPPLHWNELLTGPNQTPATFTLNLTDLATTKNVEDALQLALESQRLTSPNRQLLTLNALERAILILNENSLPHGRAQRDERIERVLDYISTHYHQPLTLNTIARQVFLSPSRFSTLFKLHIGQSPMHYLEQFRLERAAEKLLSNRDPIERIAVSVGFNNPFHFSTRFRRHFGRSPRYYRISPK